MILESSPLSVIDVSTWVRAEENPLGSMYAEGSLSKHTLINDGELYLFKETWTRNRREYGESVSHQFWSEIVAAILGEIMGLNIPQTYIAINNNPDISFKVGTLTKWFYKKSDTYVKGSDFLSSHIPDYSEKAHNLDSILKLTSHIKGNIQHWVEAILFDALICNTDRHHENWGIINNTTFSPLYDNGISLGWRITEDKFKGFDFNSFFSKYRHKLYLKLGYPKGFKVEEGIHYFVNEHGVNIDSMITFLNKYDDILMQNKLHECVSLGNKYLTQDSKLTLERAEFIRNLIKIRHEKLSEMIRSYAK